MLWGAFKLAVLKKIDPSVNSLAPTRNTSSYLNSIVEATNRGLEDLATMGKYIVKEYPITQQKATNLLPNPLLMMNIYQHENTDSDPYTAAGAKSYYFEVDRPAIVEITVGGVLFKTITHTGKGKLTAYKGNITNPYKRDVSITFKGSYPYQYMNIALYGLTYETDDDVPDYVSRKKYNMRTLTDDFYKLVTTDIVFQSGFNETEYEKTSGYFWEGDSVLVLDGQQKGSWIVHYYSYPKRVTEDTPDTEEIELDPEVEELLVIFCASELYEKSNVSKAQYWREQYESGKAQLNPTQAVGRQSVFVDSNGWGD